MLNKTQNGEPEELVRNRAKKVLELLSLRYPLPKTFLSHETPWQLLVATMLSAQCTDERVNKVTPSLFARWPDPASTTDATQEEMEEAVKSTGFYRNKAAHIIASARKVMEEFGGEVPRSMAELVTLPGVARKTANIVLSNSYGINEGIAVDTHVKRITKRLGLTANTDPKQVERDLMPLFPQEEWGDINHRLVLFGRDVCQARSPKCQECEMRDFCPSRS